MRILDFLSLAAVCIMTIHATVAQYYEKSGMGAIYGHSYNGGYRGLNVALGFGKGGISATGGVYGGRYDGGAAGGGYSVGSATSAGRGFGSGVVGGGGYGVGYSGATGYSNRYAYESGYGQQQWRRRYGYRERSPYGRFPSYDYDYNGAYQFRRGRRFNNYKNDYYDY